MKVRYIGLDLHSTTSVLCILNEDGQECSAHRVTTSESTLRSLLKSVEADRVQVMMEQCHLSTRISQALRGEADQVKICNPRDNRPISGAASKNDRADAWQLARQLYKDEQMREVYVPDDRRRMVFRKRFIYYQKAVVEQTRRANRLISWCRYWGADIHGRAGLTEDKFEEWIDQVHPPMQQDLRDYYQQWARQQAYVDRCWQRVKEAGSGYWEISQFRQIPGCGPVRSHGLSALLIDPERFPTASKLFAYAGYGVRKHYSDGKQVRGERLYRRGVVRLKELVAGIFFSAVRKSRKDNEIRRFFEISRRRCRSEKNARLNTIRKILRTCWSLWKYHNEYDPERFCSGRGKHAAVAGRSGG